MMVVAIAAPSGPASRARDSIRCSSTIATETFGQGRVRAARIRATRAGTGESSYYGALTGALNAAGERLKPRVFCVPNLRNRGSGSLT